MIIKIERTGGFAGLTTAHEINVDDLPSDLKAIAQDLLENRDPTLIGSTRPPKGAADHYEYRVTVRDGRNQRIIHCNQYSREDKLWPLIKYLEKDSIKSK